MFKEFFKSILALVKGHITVFKHAFKNRVTLEYPEKKESLNDNFRGKHNYDINKCLGCGICQQVCPANAIMIEKQDKKVVSYTIDYNKCIFCGNCAFYCKPKAIEMGKEYELATDNKENLIVNYKKGEENNE